MVTKLSAAFLLAVGVLFSALATRGDAQTACPVGTAPGSATCGPSTGANMPTPPPRPSGEWLDRFGAVAADKAGTGSTGVAANRLTREEAAGEAVAKCRSIGGTRCDIVLNYSNQCVAIAAPSVNGVERGGAPVTRPGKTVEAALKKAIPDCLKANRTKECIPIYSACSLPVFRTY